MSRVRELGGPLPRISPQDAVADFIRSSWENSPCPPGQPGGDSQRSASEVRRVVAPRRLLIVSPSFHGYDAAVAAAFTELGFDVTTHLYDKFAGVGAKLHNKLVLELPEQVGRDTTAQREQRAARGVIEAVRTVHPDVVLVIKGDVLPDTVWEAFDQHGAATVLWLYDEVRRTRWERERLTLPGRVASYSPLDCLAFQQQGIDAVHVPDGFDHLLEVAHRPATDETTFIGALYPNRSRVLEAIAAAGLPVRAYGRSWSHDLRDRARTWGSARPAIPAGRDLPRAAAYGVMAASRATLNIHRDQDGFTMRTFEACGVGAVQLIDRQDVAMHYEPGEELLVFESPEEAVDHVRRLERDASLAARLREAGRRRTLAEHTLVHRARTLADLW
ncbi:glycosyltransferase [Brachybacterium sp. EF45031]|nr:glycosyltransferase [Brachybacterium sillae]